MSPQCPTRLDAGTLERAAAALRNCCGVRVAPGLMRGLDDAVRAAAAELSLAPAELVRRLDEQHPASVAALVEHAVVGESYLLRHPEHFRALVDRVLPTVPPGDAVRIWSAGCAGGEEPYSVALSLLSAGCGQATVLATDVSERALARARDGRYGEWSFRGVPARERARFFAPRGTGWEVRPEVRRLVDFERHNLVRDPPPGAGFHAVFCRNVLIYFEGAQLRRALETLASALAQGGLLFLSPAEVPYAAALERELELERVDEGEVFLFRKRDAARAVPPGPRQRPSRPDGGARSNGTTGPEPVSLSGVEGQRIVGSRRALDVARAERGRLNARDHRPDGGARSNGTTGPEPVSLSGVEGQRIVGSLRALDVARAERGRLNAFDHRHEAPGLPAPPHPEADDELSAIRADYARAVAAARLGRLDEAERLAHEVAATALVPEAYLLLAMTAEHRGDLDGAMGAVRRALFLEPSLAAAHAALAVLWQRRGDASEAARSRRNALKALEGLDDAAALPGVEVTTAGGLRRALTHHQGSAPRTTETE